MAVYTPGRRRAIIILLLTSLLLLTLDLRGNALFDAARTAWERAMRPVEDAAEVVARPVRNAWRGIREYEDLRAENDELRAEVEAGRADHIQAQAVISQWQRLLVMFGLESPGSYERVVASVVGQSPVNLDQIIEINKGSDDGLRVGMPVLNESGELIGKVTTPVTSSRARVMLLTDINYAIAVKVVRPAELPTARPTSTTTTVPAQGTTVAGSTTTSTTTATTTSTTTTTTPTTTTSLPDPQRETGLLVGRGPDQPPQVQFVDDTPVFGTPQVGDIVSTAGGTDSLAPPDLPIGVVSEVRRGSPSEGWILDVAPLAATEGLEFVQVLLYAPEAEAADGD